jgi:hypothetical protein
LGQLAPASLPELFRPHIATPNVDEQKAKAYHAPMEEGRKRVLAIVAGILVARHLKTTEDLFDNRSSPRTESMVAAAVQWAERIMRKIDNVFPPSAGR